MKKELRSSPVVMRDWPEPPVALLTAQHKVISNNLTVISSNCGKVDSLSRCIASSHFGLRKEAQIL